MPDRTKLPQETIYLLVNISIQGGKPLWLPGACLSGLNLALAWLQSDLGRRITMLEEQASTPEGIAGLQAFAIVMQDNPPPEIRQQLIRRLNDAYGGTDFLVDFSLALGVAVGVGVNAASPEYEQMDLGEIMRELQGFAD